jgi:uncharacterized repeat protein (TIGR04042 family)
MRFEIVWPDGQRETCYSPSLVVQEHLTPGEAYTVADFFARSRTALVIASDRVRAKYGFPCSRAMGQLARIEAAATRYADDPQARVTCAAFMFD